MNINQHGTTYYSFKQLLYLKDETSNKKIKHYNHLKSIYVNCLRNQIN